MKGPQVFLVETMRLGIIGTGGVGGYFGGLLARAGLDVCFLARGEHLRALKNGGLRVESEEPGGFTVRNAMFTSDPAEAGVCDTLLYCVKTTSNDTTIPAIAPMMGDHSTVISLQNGVDNGNRLADAYGERRVMEGLAYIFSGVARPGVVKQTGGPRKIIFGARDAQDHGKGQAILESLLHAGIRTEYSRAIRCDVWRKFIFICGVSGMTALTRATIGEVMRYPETAQMTRRIMHETYLVARTLEVPLPEGADEACYGLIAQQNPDNRSSLSDDLASGRRLEIDSLCGFVSRQGKKHGLSTPLNDFVYATLKLADLKVASEGSSADSLTGEHDADQ